ncbi:helix-turn-helix transcriptional regulator [Thiomicrorhabdus cannonii]|uniref:helix-turn-helix transcriptional regulator n=1 Tax=Thiomicrorhabdus cannonii TaxID=2748011 RepID=UPI0015B91C4C|nr:AlpA family phage regulatory protein [Thiomicrorhabdus cannonii]
MIKKLIRIRDVVQITSMSKSQIYALAKTSEFPAPIKLGSSSFWIFSEVNEWIDSKIRIARGNSV